MFRKLLFLILFSGTANAFAQVAITPVKPSEKKIDPPVDYKQMGAPMPAIRVLKYHDTGSNQHVNTAGVPGDSVAASGKFSKKRKKRLAEEKKEESKMGSGKYLTNEDLDNGANLFVMMFNPTCSHCEDETEMLEKNITMFKKSKILLLANPVQSPYVPNFVKNFHIADYPTFYIGIDSSDFISKVYLYSALPQIDIYNKDRKLVKTFAGEIGIDSLQAYIQ